MTTNAKSGHPGGSLSCVDYLSLLYTFLLSKTGEPIVISNGHISPAVYAVLAEMGYVDKEEVVSRFRKFGSEFEGHVTRHVPGVWYGTGPLGAGVSAATGFALAQKLKKEKKKVYALVGDGESQEGQVYEMMNFAKKYALDNFIVFMDYNKVQLSGALKDIMPIAPAKLFAAAGWKVIEVNGHDYQAMWKALGQAHKTKGKPTLILGKTIMGKGAKLMESAGRKRQSTWHGKPAKELEVGPTLTKLEINEEQEKVLRAFRRKFANRRANISIPPKNVTLGAPIVYKPDELTDCRSAYGKALLDLAKRNKHIAVLTADLADSVRTNYLRDKYPTRHFDTGVAEQQMVSCAGGLSLAGFVPFCSTFGVFMTSRAKDQMRVNDINETNVKMVSTHCGLSVGEDGPTHQAIDDNNSVLGLLNTMQIEPADPNHCDRIIRFAARTKGNMYIRMGRHKLPVLTKEDGSVFFGKGYAYRYGRCDILRSGKDITIAATGATVIEALRAWEILKEQKISAEIVIVSSIKKFDTPLFTSIKKTKRVITVEDHNVYAGLGSQLALALQQKGIVPKKFESLGIKEYQLSGTAEQLYKSAKIDSSAIIKTAKKIMKK